MALLPDSITDWGYIIVAFVGGAVSIWGFFLRAKDGEGRRADEAADRLIKTLESQRDALERDNKTTLDRLNQLTIDYGKVTSENLSLRDIVQGRDKDSELFRQTVLDYQQKGIEMMQKSQMAITTVESTHTIVKTMNSNMERLADLFEKHLVRIEPMMSYVKQNTRRGKKREEKKRG